MSYSGTGTSGAVILNGITLPCAAESLSMCMRSGVGVASFTSDGVHPERSPETASGPESPPRAMATARQLGRGDVVRFYAATLACDWGIFKI